MKQSPLRMYCKEETSTALNSNWFAIKSSCFLAFFGLQLNTDLVLIHIACYCTKELFYGI